MDELEIVRTLLDAGVEKDTKTEVIDDDDANK